MALDAADMVVHITSAFSGENLLTLHVPQHVSTIKDLKRGIHDALGIP